MSKFIRQSNITEARQITESSLEEVADWSDGEVATVSGIDMILLHNRTQAAEIGDWIVKEEGFEARVWTDEDFRSQWDYAQDPEELESFKVAVSVASRTSLSPLIRAEELSDEIIEAVSSLYPPWQPDIEVSVGDLFQWDGTVVECIQAHTTQADWEPQDTPALWKVHRNTGAGDPDPWVQPQGAHDAYPAGAFVTHNGKVWENTHGDGNTWEPGEFGWTEVP